MIEKCCQDTASKFLFYSMTDKRAERIKLILDNLKPSVRISAHDLRAKAGYGKGSSLFNHDMIEVKRYFASIGIDLIHWKYHRGNWVYVIVDEEDFEGLNRINFK